MKEIKQLNPECLEFFEDIDLQKWTQSHDNEYRYGWMTSNAAECMNGVFKGARMLPMTSLVRLTFYRTILYFERRIAEISEAVDRGEVYTEYAMKKLKRWETRASAHSVTSIDRETQTFEVHTGMSMISPYKGQHTQVVTLVHYMFLQFLFDFDQAGTYAWGAATLAWLYRKLCQASNAQFLEIDGPLMLLQVWAYDRFSIIAPQRTLQHSDGRPLSFSDIQATSEQSGNMLLIYRWTFDRLSRSQINWTPYTPDIMASLPVRCQSGQAVWTYVGPLICFHLVEKHQPDRVLRQFNMLQTPPAISYTDQRLHQIDLRGKHDQDWRRIHAEHIGVWNSRYDFRVEAPTTSEPTVSENYFVWYRSITRRFITQEGAFYHCMYDFVDEVQTFSVEHDIEALGQICDRTTERVDHIIQQTRRLTVADTDRRRMRRRRRRQGDDVVEGDEDN
ncbi:serine/threonine-protein phosphatase 7 long form-like protein isoform X1 [Cucumis melo var. makuwa]|uniref:Serine/threonine-protein phosphatase 7 long form-like protein isoform X1 n=1 Tax=Cucumis melo var. makuwa TaxID=1194695 RepID=A0A5D3BQW5_CUCMM|nr:serine/threonine-protein phosphatase 7 long form-like protein isoform X1 [Cucumis melo var. makuwa]